MIRRLCAAAVMSAAVVCSPFLSGQSPTWPGSRARHHLALDPRSQQLLLFGGAQNVSASGPQYDNALWSWDGSAWRSMAGSPPARSNDAVAFDLHRGRLVMYGGDISSRGEIDETWEWDGKAWQLSASSGAGPRAHHAMVFDAARNQMIVFGNSDDAVANDTWGWDGKAWTRLADSGPPRRGIPALAYDEARRVVVMFGGFGPNATLLNDTWEWNGRQWTQVTTPTLPLPRGDASMAYDPGSRRIILFGGRNAWRPARNLDDTWAFDGRAWTRLDVSGPSPRNGHAMAYHPGRKTIVMFGGRNEPAYFNDLWEFDGTWRQVAQR